ncbi:MAG: TetR family transcriptional regulator [Sutterellaceae bacterium]|nr:TetR family transcriptional regulator [Sutterellaceae bacterium]MDD7442149.1 TetR/AcrR family transcriptional regulator [Sutterellaceae bacterium]MDY2868410.1 TetR/AcrR family transcriptional regulator [Mesosutterella sp.]
MSRKGDASRSDGQRTRERILQAAIRLIGEKGIDGTQSKEIAAAAGVDVASINYHFGSRKGLIEASLIRSHHDLVSLEALKRILAKDETPEEKLSELIRSFAGAARNGRSPALLVISRAFLGPSPMLQALFEKEALPKLDLLLGLVSQISRIPRGDPELLQCLSFVLAPCFLIIAFSTLNFAGPIGQAISGSDDETLARNLSSYATGGLHAIAEARGKSGPEGSCASRGNPTAR